VISAVERIYRELARPGAPVVREEPAEPVKRSELDRDQVQAILQRQRAATSEELQSIISNSKKYKLTQSERDQLSVDLTIQMAQARQGRGRRDDPNARFITQVLNLVETPFGLIDRFFIEDLIRAGSENIGRCKHHQMPRCDCWSQQRAIIGQVLSIYGERTPETWAAMRVNALLEEVECGARPETHASIV
jgi:hypothetical protein